jgi:hypothetical protein
MYIVKLNKELFINIDVNKTFYNFDNSNFRLKDKFTGFMDADYENVFSKNNNGDFVNQFNDISGFINLKTNNKNSYFFNVFKSAYNGDNKKYFMSLFETYNRIREQLLLSYTLTQHYGLLAIGPLIAYNTNNIISNKSNKKIINEYSIYNLVDVNNSINNSIYGSISNKAKTDPAEYKKLSMINKLGSSKFNSIKYSNLNYSKYYNKNDLGDILNDHNSNLNIIYSIMYKSLYDIVNYKSSKRNLYDLLIKSIELDYYSILFMYSNINSDLYSKIIDTSVLTNKYVYKLIKSYELYLPDFIEWKKQYVNGVVVDKFKMHDVDIDNSLRFRETVDTYLTDYDSTVKSVLGDYTYISDSVFDALRPDRDIIKILKALPKSATGKAALAAAGITPPTITPTLGSIYKSTSKWFSTI